MARLEKIFISGIRSYGIEKDDAQSFRFLKPVTVFLGQNGCGKTTIIECIRHALTGDFPLGGKNGQNFVADPKLYNQIFVKGCIKMVFTDVHSNEATISRTLKLSIVKDKPKFSTEDTTYSYTDEHGTEKTISGKLVDCKAMLTRLIGVPEAVLNNVLFSDYDDSLWPLGEDGQVKKKFDLIFDSSKYEQATDVVKKLIKDHNETLKSLHKELVLLHEIKEAALAKQANLKEKKDNMELLQKDQEELKRSLVPLKARLDEVLGLEASICELRNLKSAKDNELKSNKDLQRTLKELIKYEFDGTDEELEHEIMNFRKKFEEKNAQLQSIERQMAALNKEVQDLSKQQQNEQTQLSTIQIEMKNAQTKVLERDELVNSLFERFHKSSSTDFNQNLQELIALCADERNALDAKERKCEELENEAQNQVHLAQQHHMNVTSQNAAKIKELEATQDAKRTTDSQLEELSASDIEFQNYERKIARVGTDINSLLASYNEDSIFKGIEKNRKTIRGLDETIDELEADLKIYLNNSYIEKEIDNLRSEVISKEKDSRSLKIKHHNDFKVIFGDNVPSKSIKLEVDTLKDKYSRTMRMLKENLIAKEKKVSSMETNFKHEKFQLESMQNEFNTGKKKIEKICGSQGFDETLQATSVKNESLQKEKGQVCAFQIIYRDLIEKLKEKKCCPICENSFSTNGTGLNKVAATMNAKIEKVPARLALVERELEKAETLHSDLLKLSTVNTKVSELRSKLPKAQAQVADIAAGVETNRKEIAEMKKEIDRDQKILDACIHVVSSAALIDRYTDDVGKAEVKIRDLECKIVRTENNHTKAETESLIEESKEKIKELNAENERLQKKITTNQKRLNDLRTEKNELIDAQLQLQRLVQSKPQLLERQKELHDKENQLQEELTDFQMQLMGLIADLEEAKYTLSQLKEKHAIELRSIKAQLQTHESILKDVQRINNEIMIIEGKNLQYECVGIETHLQELLNQRKSIEQKYGQHNRERDNLKDELRDQDATSSSLQNNRKLRDYQKSQIKLERAVESINQEIGAQNYVTIDREKVKLQKEIHETEGTLASIRGRMTELQKSIEEVSNDIRMMVENPIKKYFLKLSEIQFEKAALEDCKEMINVVSNALSKFHRERLLSINLRLKELWKSVYRGNDIEYIQIESGETEMLNVKRVYNYCIMQKRGETVVPMRGKCSAGQKVLACVLTRIVLAEHFSAQCGIFSLDEPTTNLDRENIISLSHSLAKLVSTHQAQRNFQFIIITHDEQFLQALRQVDAVRTFYRVSRDIKGNSRVISENL